MDARLTGNKNKTDFRLKYDVKHWQH